MLHFVQIYLNFILYSIYLFGGKFRREASFFDTKSMIFDILLIQTVAMETCSGEGYEVLKWCFLKELFITGACGIGS